MSTCCCPGYVSHNHYILVYLLYYGVNTRMIYRILKDELLWLLQSNAAVVLTGPRQIGKTTLAREVTQVQDAIYRDLENPREFDQVQGSITSFLAADKQPLEAAPRPSFLQ